MTSKSNRKEAVMALLFVLIALSAALASAPPTAAASFPEGNWTSWSLLTYAHVSGGSDTHTVAVQIYDAGYMVSIGNLGSVAYLNFSSSGVTVLNDSTSTMGNLREPTAGSGSLNGYANFNTVASENGTYFIATDGYTETQAFIFKGSSTCSPFTFNCDALQDINTTAQAFFPAYGSINLMAISASGRYVVLVSNRNEPSTFYEIWEANGTPAPLPGSLPTCSAGQYLTSNSSGTFCLELSRASGPSSCDPFLGYVCTSSETSTSSVQSVEGTATCGPNQCLPPDVTIAGIPVLDLVFGIAIILLVLVAAYLYGRTKKKDRGGLSQAESSSRIL
jgi:hypothetical protein